MILAGGSSQWPFVADVVTDALGVERSRLMRSDRPYAVIAQGLSILPALQKKFDETREELRHDLPRFCRTQVRPLVEKVTDRYVAGVAADVTTELFDKIIRPILEEFRQKGGSVKTLRDAISGHVKANEAKLTEIIEGRMRTLRLGLPGELNELLREWFGLYGLSVGDKPLEEAQRTGAGQDLIPPSTPDLYGSIMDVVGWFVVALAATAGAAISGGGGLHLLAAGPVGWVIGGVLVAVVGLPGRPLRHGPRPGTGRHLERAALGGAEHSDGVADREHANGFPDPPGEDPPPRNRGFARRARIPHPHDHGKPDRESLRNHATVAGAGSDTVTVLRERRGPQSDRRTIWSAQAKAEHPSLRTPRSPRSRPPAGC